MIPAVTLLAVSLPDTPTFAENLQYQITGMLVVLFSLGSMALLVWLAGRLFIIRDRQKLAAKQAAAARAGEIPGEVRAVIAAAVSAALEDRQFVIYGVRSSDPRANLAWGAEGRRNIYASRKLR